MVINKTRANQIWMLFMYSLTQIRVIDICVIYSGEALQPSANNCLTIVSVPPVREECEKEKPGNELQSKTDRVICYW